MRHLVKRKDLILAEYPVRIERQQNQSPSLNFWDQPITYHIKQKSSSKARSYRNSISIYNLAILGTHFQTLNEFFRHEGLLIEDGLDVCSGVFESRQQVRRVIEKYELRFDHKEHSIWWLCKDPWNRLLHECPTATRPKDLWHDKPENEVRRAA